MNTEDFVTYKQAVKLKKLGFKEICNHWYRCESKELKEVFYNPDTALDYTEPTSYGDFNSGDWDVISAPTLAQAQNWLFEKGYFIEINWYFLNDTYFFSIIHLNNERNSRVVDERDYNTPNEALSAGITEVLKILERTK